MHPQTDGLGPAVRDEAETETEKHTRGGRGRNRETTRKVDETETETEKYTRGGDGRKARGSARDGETGREPETSGEGCAEGQRTSETNEKVNLKAHGEKCSQK